jgi:endonuclease/exonuclease/phosphatase family metal-dependent hydrolase
MRAAQSGALVLLCGLCGLSVACGSGDVPASLSVEARSAASRSGDSHQSERHGKEIDVLTRNLYLGADLTPVIQAQNLQQFLAATTAVWNMVNKNNFHARAQALANEIAARRPALIGLQEAFTWRVQTPADGQATPATQVAYDYVPELLGALARRGLHYRVAAQVDLLDFEAPTLLGNDARLTDHGVILARVDVKTRSPAGVVFTNLLPVSVLGQSLPVKRGYAAVDAKIKGEWVRFVTTHLESFHPGIRTLQAAELAAALASETRPVILVGDLNSHPGTEGEAVLAGAGFQDVWAELHPSRPGLTCCWPEDLTATQPGFSERIDYVMTRGPLDGRRVEVFGADPAARVGGLWPSDHGGLFATVALFAGKDHDDDDD